MMIYTLPVFHQLFALSFLYRVLHELLRALSILPAENGCSLQPSPLDFQEPSYLYF
jgi:hypothetical protein